MHNDDRRPTGQSSILSSRFHARGNGRKVGRISKTLHDGYRIRNNNVEMKSSKKKKERRKEKGRRGFEHAEENNRRTGGGVLSTTVDGKVDLELRNRSTLPRSPPALDHVATGVPRSRFFLPSTLAFPFWRGKGKLREPEFFQNVKSWRIYRESLLN